MTWDNYGTYWHIDHIRPISSFSFETYYDPDFKICWALENLQPLEAKANRLKSNKIIDYAQKLKATIQNTDTSEHLQVK